MLPAACLPCENRIQRYEKKCTIANLPEEKLHESAFFVQLPTKKSSRVSRLDCLSQNFCHESFPNYALPVTTKPADAYTYNYEEHQGYTDVQGYAVEPRHVTFGWKLHKHLFVLIDSVGGCNCSIAPNGTKVFYRPTSSPSLIRRGVITIRGFGAGDANNGAITDNNTVTHQSVTDNNAVVARNADQRSSGLAACKQQETNR